MSGYKIQSHKSLFDEMKAIARGEKPAPVDAAMLSVESAEMRLKSLADVARVPLTTSD